MVASRSNPTTLQQCSEGDSGATAKMTSLITLPRDVLHYMVRSMEPRVQLKLASISPFLFQFILFDVLHVDELDIELPPILDKAGCRGYYSKTKTEYDQWTERYSTYIGYEYCDRCKKGWLEAGEVQVCEDWNGFCCTDCREERHENTRSKYGITYDECGCEICKKNQAGAYEGISEYEMGQMGDGDFGGISKSVRVRYEGQGFASDDEEEEERRGGEGEGRRRRGRTGRSRETSRS